MSVAQHREWLLVRAGLAAVLMVAVGQVVAWALVAEQTPLERTIRCLESGKGLETRETRDPIAASAGNGSFATTIEGNDVSVSFPADAADAARIRRAYHQVGGPLVGQLHSRESAIYLWARPATATQVQKTYDCAY